MLVFSIVEHLLGYYKGNGDFTRNMTLHVEIEFESLTFTLIRFKLKMYNYLDCSIQENCSNELVIYFSQMRELHIECNI